MDITELLGASNLKKLRFLELLNTNASEWVSKENLAVNLNVSINGLLLLYESVSFSNFDLMSKIKIESNSSLGFKLATPISFILDEIRLELLKSEISFNLLIDSFNNNYVSKNIFLERMFISRATFYREINKLKHFLMKFDLSFNSKSGKVIGELSQVRKFYFHLFWEACKNFDWPFQKISFYEIQNELDNFQKNASIDLDIVTKRRFILFLAVVFNDIQQSLFINKKDKVKIETNPLFYAISQLFKSRYYLVKEKEIEKEINYVYHFFLSFLASNKEKKIYEIAMVYFKENQSEQYAFADELLTNIEIDFPTIFKNSGEKENVLFSGVQLVIEIKSFGVVYFDNYKQMLLTYNNEFQCKLEKNLEKLIRKCNLSYIDKSVFDFIVIMISNYFYFSVDLKSTMTEYTVMIITESYNHERYIKSRLNELIPMKLNVIDKPVIGENVDIIITDMKCTAFYPNIPSFNILDIFSKKDWAKLTERMLTYNSQKKKIFRRSYYAD